MELSELLLGLLLGVTGLVPFVHVNTIVELTKHIEFQDYALFAVALVFSRIGFELLANIKLGLAGGEPALSLESYNRTERDISVLKKTLTHAVGAMLFSAVLFPFYSLVGNSVRQLVSPAVPILLFGVFAWFVATHENKFNALLVGLLSGAGGVIILQKNFENSLFILLTGLYAVPSLFGQRETILDGNQPQAQIYPPLLLMTIGSLIGMSSAFLPAMTPAMLTIVALGFMERKTPNDFIALNASVIGSRLVSDFAALEFIEKARSGVASHLLEKQFFTFGEIYPLILIGIAIAAAASLVAMQFFKLLPENPFPTGAKLIAAALIFTYGFYSAGLIGVAALATCALIGLTAAEFQVGKAVLGSSILFASIANYV